MATDNIIEAVFKLHKNNAPTEWRALNVIHFKCSYVSNKTWATSSAAIADTLSTQFSSRYKSCIGSDWYYAGVTCYQVGNDERSYGQDNVSGAGPGTFGDPSLPSQNAFVIKKKTDRSGREFRGRLYLPGIPMERCNGGTVDDQYIAQISAANWTAVLTQQINVPGTDPDCVLRCILSKAPFVIHPVNSAAWRTVNAIGWDRPIRAQRRRQTGRGY